MNQIKVFRWLVGLLALCCFGCAAVNVDVGTTVDWGKISRVAYQPPERDAWQLTPAIHAELEALGFTVLDSKDTSADLLVRYFIKEGPDLNADGDLLTRLKSIHVQFVRPGTKDNVAVIDYFYPDSLANPQEDGVQVAFTELRQEIRSSQRQANPPPGPARRKTAVQEPANTFAPNAQTHLESQPTTAAPPAPTTPKTQPTLTEQHKTEGSLAPVQETAPATATVTPTVEKAEARRITPRTESPWVPRFHSWGFENWGEEDPLDDY